MTANELMCGDWVSATAEDGITYIGKVESIGILRDLDMKATLVRIYVDSDKRLYVDMLVEKVEPIPLTEEILEKNGWDIGPYSILKVCNDKWLEFYHHERRLRLWWKGIDEWQNDAEVQEVCFQCNCTYVHEFQHALRLCGLNEMAENIKV